MTPKEIRKLKDSELGALLNKEGICDSPDMCQAMEAELTCGQWHRYIHYLNFKSWDECNAPDEPHEPRVIAKKYIFLNMRARRRAEALLFATAAAEDYTPVSTYLIDIGDGAKWLKMNFRSEDDLQEAME